MEILLESGVVFFPGGLCRTLVLYSLPRAVWYFPGTRGGNEVSQPLNLIYNPKLVHKSKFDHYDVTRKTPLLNRVGQPLLRLSDTLLRVLNKKFLMTHQKILIDSILLR